MDYDWLFHSMYDAFNRRDIDAVFEHMSDDVDWPKAFLGGRAIGKDEVREYWTHQWTEIDPIVIPTQIEPEAGQIIVHVDQTVRDLQGNELDHLQVQHIYTLRDGRIAKMDLG